MATTTTNFGWDIPQSTDLVKDGATAIAALGQDIDTAMVDLKGGTTGQVLAKASGTDLDFSWVAQDDSNAIQNAIVDAKGDLIAATAADTPARLAVGTNGQVLVADSTAATGLAWATPAGGGKILQVIHASTTTQTAIASTSYTDTGLSATITPSSASSRILIMASQVVLAERSSTNNTAGINLVRTSTSIGPFGGADTMFSIGTVTNTVGFLQTRTINNISWVDSPSTTSAVTYKTQAAVNTTANGGAITFQQNNLAGSMILMEIGA
jgi:hypothetical protein